MSNFNPTSNEAECAVSLHQISLFADTIAPLPQRDPRPRGKQIDSAFSKADASFIALYEAFLFSFGATHQDFTACEVTEAFTAKHYTLSDKQKKSLGGLYQRLIKRGKIEKTGIPRERNQGNLAMVYRLTRKP